MAISILSKEDLDEIVARLCEAAEIDDHEAFLEILLFGMDRMEDHELARDMIADRFTETVLQKPIEYGMKALGVMTRAVDLFWELADKAKASQSELPQSRTNKDGIKTESNRTTLMAKRT